jgi:isopenicillin-N epimerase
VERRKFLLRSGLALASGVALASCRNSETSKTNEASAADTGFDSVEWAEVRKQFQISPDYIELSGLFISSHPRVVREAIETHRRGLDENPTLYLQRMYSQGEQDTVGAAAEYLGARPQDVALTDSTTMGLGLVYNGLNLYKGQEILTTKEDYYATYESLRLASIRTGAQMREIPLFDDIQNVTEAEIVNNIVKEIRPATRVLALTWVHSSTGLKLPLRQIADQITKVNSSRKEEQRVLLSVDGVHGFGIEDVQISDLGCDFFIAGCHKWLFGPRGTGIIWANAAAWENVTPTIPTFIDDGVRDAWIREEEPSGPITGRRMTPGGFKPFEHQWAVAEAFRLHLQLSKSRVAARTHELARRLKQGLREMSHVTLYTPMSKALSSGIVSFDVRGMSPRAVVNRLREQNIVATITPYATPRARLAPSIRNSSREIDATLEAIGGMG